MEREKSLGKKEERGMKSCQLLAGGGEGVKAPEASCASDPYPCSVSTPDGL